MLAALSALLLLLVPDTTTYRVTLVDGSQTNATLFLPPNGEGTVRVETADTHAMWRPVAASGPTASVTGTLTRWEALQVKGGWRLQRPVGGALPLRAPLLTFHDMRLFLGQRYDELKSRPRRFLQLGYAEERPGLDQVELTPAGTEKVLIAGKPITARRLRFSAKLWLNGKTQRGTIAVGPSGELLRADPPFVSTPLRAASLLTKMPSGALVMTYAQPSYTLRAEPVEGGGYRIKTLVDGQALLGAVTTDAAGHPTRIENDWPGKPFVGLVEDGTLSWTLDAPSVSRTLQPEESDLVLFPPQLFATAAWEKELTAVGEKRSAILLLLHDGLPEELELERLPDPKVGLHRYRAAGDTIKADIITDGTQLRLLRFADGATIVGMGSESLTQLAPLAWP